MDETIEGPTKRSTDFDLLESALKDVTASTADLRGVVGDTLTQMGVAPKEEAIAEAEERAPPQNRIQQVHDTLKTTHSIINEIREDVLRIKGLF